MAGKFQALRVEWKSGTLPYTSWYAAGVGEVKRVARQGDEATVTRTLRSFEAKPARK